MPEQNSKTQKDKARELAIRALVPCPICGAQKNAQCREGATLHPSWLGEDRRTTLNRCHADRRAAWIQAKAQQ